MFRNEATDPIFRRLCTFLYSCLADQVARNSASQGFLSNSTLNESSYVMPTLVSTTLDIATASVEQTDYPWDWPQIPMVITCSKKATKGESRETDGRVCNTSS